jgi:hypothetical protein
MNGQPLSRLTNRPPNRRRKARHGSFKTGATPLTAMVAPAATKNRHFPDNRRIHYDKTQFSLSLEQFSLRSHPIV